MWSTRVCLVIDALDNLFAKRAEILSVQEVAQLLGMNKAGVYKWLREGVIPGYHRGHSWFIVRDELKEWIRQGSNQPGQPDVTDPADRPVHDNGTAGASQTQTD